MNTAILASLASGYDHQIPWLHMLPVIIILGGAAVGVLLEAFVSRKARWLTQTIYTPLIILASLVALTYSATKLLASQQGVVLAAHEEILIDNIALFGEGIILVIGILAVLVMIDRTSKLDGAFAGQPSDRPGSYDEELTDRMGYQRSEIFPLTLFSLGGMMVFPMANSMLTMFIALEMVSLPLYVLAATSRRRRLLSQEAALKYFILGAFSSAFFLMGIVLLYGYSGSLKLFGTQTGVYNSVIEGIDPATHTLMGPPYLLIVGAVMLTVGLLFKVGAAPFHAWTPDVYQGAPTPVTGFMAAGVKVAAFLIFLRVHFTLLVTLQLVPGGKGFVVFMWAVAILTMVVGTYFGLVQKNIKRMLAYSSIAHAGFILIAFAVPGTVMTVPAVIFYVLSYGIATVGAFAVIYLVRRTSDDGTILGEAHDIDDWKGLGKTSPLLAGSMMIFLLSFAGIPLTSGFIGKFLVFSAGVSGGATALVVIAVIASAITAFYYFRLAGHMFLHEPSEQVKAATSTGPAIAVITVSAVVTIVLGVLPNLILGLF